MKKLVLLVVFALSTVLLLPSVASASTPTSYSSPRLSLPCRRRRRARQLRSSRCRAQSRRCKARSALRPQRSPARPRRSRRCRARSAACRARSEKRRPRARPGALRQGLLVGHQRRQGPQHLSSAASMCRSAAPLPKTIPPVWATSSSAGTTIPSVLPSGYRAGSNNLVCGDRNSFTSYGGFLAGQLQHGQRHPMPASAAAARTSANGSECQRQRRRLQPGERLRCQRQRRHHEQGRQASTPPSAPAAASPRPRSRAGAIRDLRRRHA